MVMFLEKPRFDPASKAVGGEEATAGEIFDTTRESMRVVDNANSRLRAWEEAYDARIAAVKQATGVQLNNPVSSGAGGPSTMAGFGVQEETDPHAEFQRRLEELAAEKPELRDVIKPDRPVLEDAKARAQAAEKAFEDTWSRSSGGLAAWAARLGGGFYGAMHDPVNIFTLPLGPTGKAGTGAKGLLWMGLKQGAANAGTEAMIQPFVQQWRKDSNLDYGLGQAALNIAGSGLFGAAVDIGVRAPVRGVRRAVGRPYLGPDEPGSGARLPDLPEGPPPSTPAAPRIYRGPDPLPPLEALEQAARNAPEGSVLRRASEGDEDALRQLAAELGEDGDPAIRRALDELEIEKLFPTPLHVDDGAHLESLARAIREESGAADLPVGDAIAAPIRREVARLADEVEGIAARLEDKPVAFRSIDPATVTTDASTFQFKSGGDVSGVTDRLRGVTRWDPVSAGKAIVFERADGSLVIADGHQRLGLAKRVAASGQDAKLDAYVFREADGWTPEDVRAYAALKNMRESSGTSLDMAQVMRDRPDLIDGSLPLTDAKLRDAAMLARLSPEAFDAVVAGRLPPPFAALIGESVADSARHRGLLDEMAAADLANTQQARLYLKQLMELPTTTETQMTLFGEESFTRTVLIERAQVLDGALKTLKADKRIFGLLRDKARAIESAGNVLARDVNQAKAENAAQLADLIEKLATSRGPVATILNDAAASVARGLDPKLASRAFVDRIADTLEREGLPGLVRAEEAPKAELAPVRMDDPIGPEAKAQMEDINWALELDDEIKFAMTGLRAKRYTAPEVETPDQIADALKTIRASVEDAQTAPLTGRFAPDDLRARFVAYKKADTDLRAAMIGGLDEADALARYADVRAQAESIVNDLRKTDARINRDIEKDIKARGGTADDAMFSLRAYHGSPHDFDRFRMDRIGTGEGAQVFGHGLYFAENEGVAAQYRDALGTYTLDGKRVEGEIDDGELRHFVEAKRDGYLDEIIADYQKRRDEAAVREETDVSLLDRLQGRDKASILEQLDGLIANATRVRDSKVEIQGSLFEVDIDVESHQLLDYDAKLADQPEMLAKMEKLLRDAGSDVSPDILRTQPGSWAYSELEAMLGSADAASRALKEAGIPGLRYFDAGSRGGPGEASRNIVIFDDSLIKITHKNGKAVSVEERKAAVDAMFSLRGGKADQTQTPEFKRWFGDSKVVDEGGKPLRVYHGGPGSNPYMAAKGDVEAFRANEDGLIYFTDKPELAGDYATARYPGRGATYPVYLRMQDPLIVDRVADLSAQRDLVRKAKAAGNDGLILKNADDSVTGQPQRDLSTVYIAFDPTQIKSAIGNRGTFDPNDPRIAFSTPPRNATLHNTTLSTRAADEMASMRAEIDNVIAKSLPPGWRAEVRQRLVFGDLSERIQKRNPGVPPSLEIEGTFDPYEKIIYVSMAALDPVERAYEEAGHALKSMRLIPEADYGILQAKAKEIGARQRFRIDERYGDVYGARWKDNPARLEEALEEEAIMQMVAARARGDTFGRQANAILDKLIKFLRAVRDMLGMKGFRTFEDVFEDMTEGGFARAMEAQRGQAVRNADRLGGEVMASNSGPGVMSTAFRRWFGDSKVVDAEGKPLVVYHQTAQENVASIEQTGFDLGRIGARGSDEQMPDGIFLKPTTDQIGVGSVDSAAQMPLYATIKNPLIVADRQALARFLGGDKEYARLSKAVDELDTALAAEYDALETRVDASDDEIAALFERGNAQLRQAAAAARARATAVLKAAGHDGLIVERDAGSFGRSTKTIVAFEPTQVKGIGNRGTFDPSDPRINFALPLSPTAADASFIARAQAASEIMFALGDEGKGKTPEKGGDAKPAPERPAEGKAPAKTAATPSLPGGRESKRIRNLINQAAAEGKLPREDADALIQRFDMLEAFHKDGGKAKQQIARELDAEAEHRKRQKALAEGRRRAIVTMLTGFRDARGQADPAKAMQALIENLGQHELPQGFTDVAGHQRAIYGMALADLDAMLHEFRKTLITGTTRNKAQLANVVRELHGEATGDEMAAAFAQSVAKVMEDLRLRFNAAGGNIAKRKDWHMPQSHDKVALLKAGKETWVEFTLPQLDLKWMKHPLTGDDMPPVEVRKMLGDVWDNLVSDGWHEREAAMAHRGVSAIANTRADPRSLIFANANAWMKYSERFGSGDDALAILVSHIRGMTKDIAAMEVLGPNPKAMLEYLKQFVIQQATLRRAGMAAHFPTVTEVTGRALRAGGGIFARDPVEGYAKSMIARAENMWNIYSGASSAPVNATLAAASQTIRNVNVATKLGGATVSALSDPFWQVAARKFAGLPATRIIRDVVAQIGSAGEREARRAGVIAETYLHLHNEGAREGAALSATKISAYVADRVLSLSMLNAVTRYGNHAMSMGIQGHLADMAGKAFADLDPRLQRMFRRWGLEATDWDAIRLDAGGRPREVDFLSPADIRRQLVDNGGDPSIAERYLAMTLGEAQYATLTGSIRGQAIVYGSLRAGTAQRELWSMFMQFKSFAVNLAILQLERIAREFVANGFWRGAQYAGYALVAATVGGALIEQLQQLRNGKDPRDMTTPEFWGSAAYRSGGLSIWGDLLYASENRFGGGVASTIAGPSASTLNDILNLTYGSAKKAVLFTDNKERTNFGREATNFVKRYTPGASLWYVRTAWERVLMDNLQRMLDPEADASFRRKLQNARRDYKQEFWWKPGGGATPQRLPSLGAALPAR